MLKMRKSTGRQTRAGEKGQVIMALALILMLIIGLIIPPLLSFVSTSVSTHHDLTSSSGQLYAADAGIEDAMWHIKYDHLGDLIAAPDDTTAPGGNYDEYNYTSTWATQWSATSPYVPESLTTASGTGQVNSTDVAYSLQNVWIPKNIQPPPDPTTARGIIEANKLVVTGTNDTSTQVSTIKFSYTPNVLNGETLSSLGVVTVGVWLPNGYDFSLVDNNLLHNQNSNPIESDLYSDYDYPPGTKLFDTEIIYDWAGNKAVVWTFSSKVFNQLPPGGSGTSTAPWTATMHFKYTTTSGGNPDTIAWMTTSGVSDIPYSWNVDKTIYKITSDAGDLSQVASGGTGYTDIVSYTSKSQIRQTTSAIAGDYYAAGGSLLTGSGSTRGTPTVDPVSGSGFSSSTVSAIPTDADVKAAYLYWSAWLSDTSATAVPPLAPDNGSNIVINWNNGAAWSNSSPTGNFVGHYSSGGDPARLLTLKNSLSTSSESATVAWDQWLTIASPVFGPDHCDNLNNWDVSSPTASNQTQVPTADGDISGTWGNVQTQTQVPTGDGDVSGTWGTSTTISTGWLSPSANAADTGGDNNGFELNPTYAYADDTSYASNIDGAADRHKFYGYNTSSIPTGSGILGIEVRLDWWLDSTSGTNTMSAELSWDGGTSWTTPLKNTTTEPTSDGNNIILGTSSDTWGRTWTTSELSNTNFRVRLTCNSSSSTRDFYLDYVPIRITYSSPPRYPFIDETTADDNDYITGTTDGGGYALFTASPFSIPAGSNITNLTIYYRARDVTSGTNYIRAAIKVGDTVYNTTGAWNNPPAPTSLYTTYSNAFSTNPKTGAKWTVADINGTGPNPLQQFGVVSNDLAPDINVSMVYAVVNYGTLYTNIDETSPGDGDFITGTLPDTGGYALFTFSNFSVPSGSLITDLTVYIRASDIGAAGGNNIYERIKVGDSYYNGGTLHNPPASTIPTTYSYSWTTNPDTPGVAWTVDDINGIGSNPLQQIGVYSTDLNPDINVYMVYAQVNYTGNHSLWSSVSGELQGKGDASATDDRRTLTLKTGLVDLHTYSSGTVSVSWNQRASSTVDSTDHFYYALYNGTWSSNYEVFYGNSPTSPFSVVIPDAYLIGNSNFKIRFYFDFNNADEYVYIDNITIGGAYSSSEGLDFAFSKDNGTTWSNYYQAFRGTTDSFGNTVPTSNPASNNYSFQIPSTYLTPNFKMRFNLVGFTAASCNIDDIRVTTTLNPDTNVIFKINDVQVSFDSSGNKEYNTTDKLKASAAQVVRNYQNLTSPHGYSYTGFRDVTALVRAYTQAPTPPATNYPANAKYTVGDVSVSTDDEWSYSGWSLILIYTSEQTQGHQLYLYDKFVYSNQNSGYTPLDVDWDGGYQPTDAGYTPGGYISGFIVPPRIQNSDGTWEANAAKITCFVGEGDEQYSGDFIALNAYDGSHHDYSTHPGDIPNNFKLWDGTTSTAPAGDPSGNPLPNSSASPNNVWNSKSVGLNASGVDVDTFNVTWDSGLLNEGDTSARLDMVTRVDVWNMVYIILSFRSSVTTGGSISYLITKH